MATQTINFPYLAGGSGLSLRLRLLTTRAIVATASATESTANNGVQTSNFTDIAAGSYLLQLIEGNDILGQDAITLTLTTGQFWPDSVSGSSSGGTGDAQQATLLLVKTKTDLIGTAQANVALTAAAVLAPGTITGFPEELIIGDSYDEDTGTIDVSILDSEGDPITTIGSLALSDATVEFVAYRPGDPEAKWIIGTCDYASSVVSVTLPSSETAKGVAEFTYEGRLKFIWSVADAQKTFKTTQFKFVENP